MTLSNIPKAKHHLSTTILLTAILMMGSSAVMTYFITKQNDTRITALSMEIENKQTLIKDVWNNAVENQNKANFAILLTLFSNQNSTDISALKEYYLSQFSGLGSQSNVQDILKSVEQTNQNNSENINSLYFEESTLQKKVYEIKQSNRLYTMVAVFLQIIGLVLIIIRKDMLAK